MTKSFTFQEVRSLIISGQGVVIPTADELRATADQYDRWLAEEGRGATRMDDKCLALHKVIAGTILASVIVPAPAGKALANAREVERYAETHDGVCYVDLDWREVVGPGKAVNNLHNAYNLATVTDRPSPAHMLGSAGLVAFKRIQRGSEVLRFYRKA